MIKVVLVDDYAVVREGLYVLLSCDKDCEVVAEADGPDSLLHLFSQGLLCDVVLLDVFWDGTPSGLDLIPTLCNLPRSPQILMVSMCTDQVLVTECLRLGARGFLAKMDVSQHLSQAVHAVCEHMTYISPSLQLQFSNACDGDHSSDLDVLTPLELEVLGLLGEGCSTRRMAKVLGIASGTLQRHMERLKIKLCCDDDNALLNFAKQREKVLK